MAKLYSEQCSKCGGTFIFRESDLDADVTLIASRAVDIPGMSSIGCSFCHAGSLVGKNQLHPLEDPYLTQVKNAKRWAALAGLTQILFGIALQTGLGEAMLRFGSERWGAVTTIVLFLVVLCVPPAIAAGLLAPKLGRRAWPWILAAIILNWIVLLVLAGSRPMNIIPQASCAACNKVIKPLSVQGGMWGGTVADMPKIESDNGFVCESCGHIICVVCSGKKGSERGIREFVCTKCGHSPLKTFYRGD